jgi:Spy/CpxP family protein refolding chaperone
MKRTIRNAFASLSVVGVLGALAVVPARMAYADQAPAEAHHHHGHRPGLFGAALKLDSLTPQQRTSIEGLIQQDRAARTPVRQADAPVLEALAHQVEQASIDPQGLSPVLNVEKTAEAAEVGVERSSLNSLHGLLTPAQRATLVDGIESHQHGHHGRADAGANRTGDHGLGLTPEQRAQIAANLRAEVPAGQGGKMHAMLEAFRGDTFDASGFVSGVAPGERAERLAQAMVPVLTPAQRAILASHLRTRAARESRS